MIALCSIPAALAFLVACVLVRGSKSGFWASWAKKSPRKLDRKSLPNYAQLRMGSSQSSTQSPPPKQSSRISAKSSASRPAGKSGGKMDHLWLQEGFETHALALGPPGPLNPCGPWGSWEGVRVRASSLTLAGQVGGRALGEGSRVICLAVFAGAWELHDES